jgi:thiol:disulfide interchange protein
MRFFLLLIILVGCAEREPNVGTENQVPVFKEIEWRLFDEGMRIGKDQKRPILLYFTAPWCVWCKKLEKDTFVDREVIEVLKRFVCIRVDVQKDRKTPVIYNVRGVPMILFLTPDGTITKTIIGFRSSKSLLEEIRR